MLELRAQQLRAGTPAAPGAAARLRAMFNRPALRTQLDPPSS